MAFSPTDIALLRSALVLRELPDPAVLDDLVTRSECQLVLQPGEVFLTAGQVSPGLHVIAHGTVEMYVADAKGEEDRKSTRLNSSHIQKSRMPSSA